MIPSFRLKKIGRWWCHLLYWKHLKEENACVKRDSMAWNSIQFVYVTFEEPVGFKWVFRYMNFVLWKMDWIKDLGLRITRIWMAFKTMRLHEAMLGVWRQESRGMKMEPWSTPFRGQEEKEEKGWPKRSSYLVHKK